MLARYEKRLVDGDLWEVYDTITGRVVIIARQPYDGMAAHEADEIIELLEAGKIRAD